MADDSLIDPATRDAELASLLEAHPEAFIAAMAPSGLLVPLPEELAATGLRPIVGPKSLINLVVSHDQRTLIEAWHGALSVGLTRCEVRLLAAPDRQVRLHQFDLTHRFGVFVGVFTGLEEYVAAVALPHDVVRPRLITMRKDQVATITAAGPELADLLGWTPEEVIGTRSLDLVHPDDHERAIASWLDMLGTPAGTARRVRLRHLHRDGHPVWFEITNHNRLADPNGPCVIAEMLDISDEMAAQEAVRAAEQLMRRLTETLPMGVLQIDADRRIVYLNDRAARALHARLGDVLDDRYLDAIVPADRPAADDAIAVVLGTGNDADVEYGSREPGRGVRRVRANLRALTSDDGAITGAIICLADVTEDVRLREELRHRATFDPLTGCHNRSATMAALQDATAAPDGHAGTAVVFLDLNGFKQVNDVYGHAAGDRLLTHVANRLRMTVPADGVVGRIGGDEFVVICRDVAGPAGAERIGADLLAGLRAEVVDAAGNVLTPEASVGVAWAPCGAAGPEELIARADAAMYQAKKTRTGPHNLVLAS
ncbi:sensor domain-containing diguanylate cyclase [Actinoplanes sp. KI2]|uniref:sensor domain-containing diguanylate cyclase n=1 Tax=Actinoplanes sp. KI2 TaxID=2983315 RepID=UPI0021D58BD3|nr:sensor domain-containing diguanylate cyclase [Actinoplanes sp. KI2]MCU7727803.1 sensor domain-containing diguanylate cyclase [Actinoplanes sp. KI2]